MGNNLCQPGYQQSFEQEEGVQPTEIDLQPFIDEQRNKPSFRLVNKQISSLLTDKLGIPKGLSLQSRYHYHLLVEGFTPGAAKNLILINLDTFRVYSITSSSIELASETKLSQSDQDYLQHNFRDRARESQRQYLKYGYAFNKKAVTLYLHPQLRNDDPAVLVFKLRPENAEVIGVERNYGFETKTPGLEESNVKAFQLVETNNLSDSPERDVLLITLTTKKLQETTPEMPGTQNETPGKELKKGFFLHFWKDQGGEDTSQNLFSFYLSDLEFNLDFDESFSKLFGDHPSRATKFKLTDIDTRHSLLICDLKRVILFLKIDFEERKVIKKVAFSMSRLNGALEKKLKQKFKITIANQVKYFRTTDSVILGVEEVRRSQLLSVKIKNIFGDLDSLDGYKVIEFMKDNLFYPYRDYDEDTILIRQDLNKMTRSEKEIDKIGFCFLNPSSFDKKGDPLATLYNAGRYNEMTHNGNEMALDFLKVSENQMLIINWYQIFLFDLETGKVIAENWYRFDFDSHCFGRKCGPFYFDDAIILVQDNNFSIATLELSPEKGEMIGEIQAVNFCDEFEKMRKEEGFKIKGKAKIFRLDNGNLVLMSKTLRKRREEENQMFSFYAIGMIEISLNPFKIVSKVYKDDFQFRALDFNSIHAYKKLIYVVFPNKKEVINSLDITQKTIQKRIKEKLNLLNPGIVGITPKFEIQGTCPTSENQPKMTILSISQHGIISTQEKTNQLYLHRIDEKQNQLILTKIVLIKTPKKILGLDNETFYSQRATSGLNFVVSDLAGTFIVRMRPNLELLSIIKTGIVGFIGRDGEGVQLKFIYGSYDQLWVVRYGSTLYQGFKETLKIHAICLSTRTLIQVKTKNLLHFDNLTEAKKTGLTVCLKDPGEIKRVWIGE